MRDETRALRIRSRASLSGSVPDSAILLTYELDAFLEFAHTHRYALKASQSESDSQKKLDTKKAHKAAAEKLAEWKKEERKEKFRNFFKKG